MTSHAQVPPRRGARVREALVVAALHAAPLIVLLELVGTHFGNPAASTVGLLGLYAGALFVARAAGEPRSAPGTGRYLLGALLAAAGLALAWPCLSALLGVRARIPEWLRAASRPEWPVLMPLLGAVVAGVGVALGTRSSAARSFERTCLLVALALTGMLAAGYRVQGLPVQPAASGPVLSAFAATLGALLLVGGGAPGLRLALLLLAALLVRARGLSVWAPEPATRDMLPLAYSAFDAWLAGENPYAVYQMQRGSQVPLTYLPGMWWLQGALRPLGLDGRFVALLADAVIAGSPWLVARRLAPGSRPAGQVAVGFAAVWLASPSVHWNGIYAEPHVWWAVLAGLSAAVVSRAWWWAGALLTLAVLTRHFALVIAPFVVVAALRDLPWRAALVRLGAPGSLGAAALAHFVARDPEAFWFGTYQWLVEYGPAHRTWFFQKLGFTGLFHQLGLAAWLPWMQAAAVSLGLLVLPFLRGPRTCLAVGGLTLAAFITCNGIVWDSFWMDAYLVGVALAVARTAGGAAREGRREVEEGSAGAQQVLAVRLGTWAAVASVAPLLAAGAWLVASWSFTRSRAGRDQLPELVSAALSPGVRLVDRAERRLAFVRGARVLDERKHLAHESVFDRATGLTWPQPGLLLVARVDRDEDLVQALRLAAPGAEERRVGRYRLLGVPPLRLAGRLGQGREGEQVPCRLGGAGVRALRLEPSARFAWSDAPPGRALAIAAGYDDAAVRWRLADSQLTVVAGAVSRGQLRVRALPGVAFGVLPRGEGPVVLEVVAAVRRGGEASPVCVEAWVLP